MPALPQQLVNVSWPTDKCNFKSPGTSLSSETAKDTFLRSHFANQEARLSKSMVFDFNQICSTLFRQLALQFTELGFNINSTQTNEAYCLPCWLFGPQLPENDQSLRNPRGKPASSPSSTQSNPLNGMNLQMFT